MPVQFNEPEFGTPNRTPQRREKGIIDLIMKMGLAKNESQANIIMVGLIVVLVLIAWVSLSSIGSSGQADNVDTPPAELDAGGEALI